MTRSDYQTIAHMAPGDCCIAIASSEVGSTRALPGASSARQKSLSKQTEFAAARRTENVCHKLTRAEQHTMPTDYFEGAHQQVHAPLSPIKRVGRLSAREIKSSTRFLHPPCSAHLLEEP